VPVITVLDLKGLSCPLPIVKTAVAIKHLQPGELVEVLATDAGSVADFTMSADRPARVETVTLRLLIPRPLAPNRRRALLAVVDHCTVHNSIRIPPEVCVTLAEPAGTRPSPLATIGA
jgi:TusA-related sulfurtransferase